MMVVMAGWNVTGAGHQLRAAPEVESQGCAVRRLEPSTEAEEAEGWWLQVCADPGLGPWRQEKGGGAEGFRRAQMVAGDDNLGRVEAWLGGEAQLGSR